MKMTASEFNRTSMRVEEHYDEALESFAKNNIVGCFLQGSQNYGLEYEGSDVDTKLILTPSFKDIALNKKAVSTTHVRANNEHTDWKDIRLYMETFRKQNLNFLEILFTNFFAINCLYAVQWGRLIEAREQIARMNPYRAVRSMYGIAGEKYHAMCHPYPSKMDIIEKYGYDGKQVSHLLRVEDYLERYIAGESYEACLRPTPSKVDEIMAYKLQQIPLEVAQPRADAVYEHCLLMKDMFCDSHKEHEDEEVRALLEDVQCNIMKISVKEEFK
jgi:hypothetical protein